MLLKKVVKHLLTFQESYLQNEIDYKVVIVNTLKRGDCKHELSKQT